MKPKRRKPKPRPKPRPRLTRVVIAGLSTVIAEAETMLDEREGWEEYHDEDDNEKKALAYMAALIDWYHAKSRRRP